MQLALDPIRTGSWDEEQTGDALGDAGIRIVSGMMAMRGEDYSTLESIRRSGGVRPDETWEDNLRAAEQNADLAARLGIGLVTFHAGFVPEERGDPERGVLVRRLIRLNAVFSSRGVVMGLETGQETARNLWGLLDELDRALEQRGDISLVYPRKMFATSRDWEVVPGGPNCAVSCLRARAGLCLRLGA